MRKFCAGIGVMVVAMFMCIQANAAENGWSYELIPYFWAIGLDGQIGVGELPPADVDASFSDIWDDFETGICFFGIAEKGPWFGMADVNFLDTESTENLPAAKVTLDNDMFIAKLVGGYRLPLDDQPIEMNVYGGARYYQFDTKLAVSGVGSQSVKEEWVDPLVGMNLVLPFDEKWRASLTADIGGFSMGSDLAWEIMPVLHHQFNDMVSAKLSYRWMDIDYDDSDYKSDVLTQGWLVGVGFAF